jgi:hypothetical protein
MSIKQLAESYRKRTGDYGHVPRLPDHDLRLGIAVWIAVGIFAVFCLMMAPS